MLRCISVSANKLGVRLTTTQLCKSSSSSSSSDDENKKEPKNKSAEARNRLNQLLQQMISVKK